MCIKIGQELQCSQSKDYNCKKSNVHKNRARIPILFAAEGYKIRIPMFVRIRSESKMFIRIGPEFQHLDG